MVWCIRIGMEANKATDGSEDKWTPTVPVFGAQITTAGRTSEPWVIPMDPHSPERAGVLQDEEMLPYLP